MRRTGAKWPAVCVLVLTACGGGSSDTPIVFDDVTTTASTAPPLADTAATDPVARVVERARHGIGGHRRRWRPPPSTTTTTLPPLTPENAPRVQWQGGTDYLLGANLPWFGWGCDFGCGSSAGGVSDPATSAAIGPVLDAAHAAGMDDRPMVAVPRRAHAVHRRRGRPAELGSSPTSTKTSTPRSSSPNGRTCHMCSRCSRDRPTSQRRG